MLIKLRLVPERHGWCVIRCPFNYDGGMCRAVNAVRDSDDGRHRAAIEGYERDDGDFGYKELPPTWCPLRAGSVTVAMETGDDNG